MNVLAKSLSLGYESDASNIMDHLLAIANIQPMFYKGSVDSVIMAMFSISSSKNLEFSTRAIAIELTVTIAETAPALARRVEGLVPGLIPILFQLMEDRDDNEADWMKQKYSHEFVDGDYTIGEEAIERLSNGIGGRMTCGEVLKYAEIYSSQSQWMKRRAAVAAVNRLAEGCPQYFSKNYLTLSKHFFLKMLNDSSPIVTYEVIQVI
jgi:hypothetical protein